MIFPLSSIIIFIIAISKTRAHSHVECAKQVDGKCLGYARYYDYNKRGYENTQESRDRNYLVSAGTQTCPSIPIAGEQEYTERYPIAKVHAGESVTIRWPPRGHTTQPNSSVFIYCSPKSGRQEPTMKQGLELIAEMPYGNCEEGGDISWAECTGTFEIPQTWQAGIKTCQWVWTLNGGQTYVDCFEYDVRSADSLESSNSTITETERPATLNTLPVLTVAKAEKKDNIGNLSKVPDDQLCKSLEDLCGLLEGASHDKCHQLLAGSC